MSEEPLSTPKAPRGAPTTARPGRALTGRVRPPGDKSLSHRALMFAGVAAGETVIEGLLEGADVLATARALSLLGADVVRTGPGAWRMRGVGASGFRSPDGPLDLGNAGTGARLLMGLVAGQGARAEFIGDQSLSARPMLRVLNPLAAMGVRVAATEGRLPARVEGVQPLRPVSWTSATASAQVKSAVLLAALGADGVTEVIEPELSRDHTERLLAAFGVHVETIHGPDGVRHRLAGPARLTAPAAPLVIPADPSSAAFALVAGLIAGGPEGVIAEGVALNPTRTGALDILRAFGADLEIVPRGRAGAEPVGDVRARPSALRAAPIPPGLSPASYIDEVPILAVAAAFAQGETVFDGVGELRVKESDRIAATCALLDAVGVRTRAWAEGFAVEGLGPERPRGGGLVRTAHDHRIAMSALVCGLGARLPVSIDDAGMIGTSYPSFFADLSGLGADVDQPGLETDR